MKIIESQLKRIIKESVRTILNEKFNSSKLRDFKKNGGRFAGHSHILSQLTDDDITDNADDALNDKNYPYLNYDQLIGDGLHISKNSPNLDKLEALEIDVMDRKDNYKGSSRYKRDYDWSDRDRRWHFMNKKDHLFHKEMIKDSGDLEFADELVDSTIDRFDLKNINPKIYTSLHNLSKYDDIVNYVCNRIVSHFKDEAKVTYSEHRHEFINVNKNDTAWYYYYCYLRDYVLKQIHILCVKKGKKATPATLSESRLNRIISKSLKDIIY